VMEPTASLNLTNALSGRTLQITLDNPGYITIDCANFTVWINNVSRLDAVNDDFKLNGFYLLPGEQQITTNVDITLLYRPRWY
jgi:phage-related protein